MAGAVLTTIHIFSDLKSQTMQWSSIIASDLLLQKLDLRKLSVLPKVTQLVAEPDVIHIYLMPNSLFLFLTNTGYCLLTNRGTPQTSSRYRCHIYLPCLCFSSIQGNYIENNGREREIINSFLISGKDETIRALHLYSESQ